MEEDQEATNSVVSLELTKEASASPSEPHDSSTQSILSLKEEDLSNRLPTDFIPYLTHQPSLDQIGPRARTSQSKRHRGDVYEQEPGPSESISSTAGVFIDYDPETSADAEVRQGNPSSSQSQVGEASGPRGSYTQPTLKHEMELGYFDRGSRDQDVGEKEDVWGPSLRHPKQARHKRTRAETASLGSTLRRKKSKYQLYSQPTQQSGTIERQVSQDQRSDDTIEELTSGDDRDVGDRSRSKVPTILSKYLLPLHPTLDLSEDSPESNSPPKTQTGRKHEPESHSLAVKRKDSGAQPSTTPLFDDTMHVYDQMGHSTSLDTLGGEKQGLLRLVRTAELSERARDGISASGIYMVKARTPAILRIEGDLEQVCEGSSWTRDEKEASRRLVLFTVTQSGTQLVLSFEIITHTDYHEQAEKDGVVVSCIYDEESGEYYITSTDVLTIMECLVGGPLNMFERNRLRRNLEFIKPRFVSKRGDTERLFKLIMSYGPPKPRRIMKDTKVFLWNSLEEALNRLLSKYSVI